MLPHLAMECGRCCAAIAVMRAASWMEVWSFQSQRWALGFFFSLFVQCQWCVLRVNRDGAGTGGVHTDANNVFGPQAVIFGGFGEGLPDGGFQAGDVILGFFPAVEGLFRQDSRPGARRDS